MHIAVDKQGNAVRFVTNKEELYAAPPIQYKDLLDLGFTEQSKLPRGTSPEAFNCL